MVPDRLAGAIAGVAAEGKGEAVCRSVVVSKESLSPNVSSSPSRETKQEAGRCRVCVPGVVTCTNSYVGYSDVRLCDTPADGEFVVVKTVKTIPSVLFLSVLL